ncbi:MAG TPA: hypothetical protein VFS88_02495 [Micavibrio sp.]|nr:hypothetical protein [Micavibrio sp.]
MGLLLEKWLPSVQQILAGDSYDPFSGWSNLAQPIAALDSKSYLEFAREGLEPLKERMVAFCEANNFSHVIIPQEEYRAGFEKGDEEFHEWFEEYCRQRGMNPAVKVVIIGPCVKDEASTDFKAKIRPDARVKDYLRGMYIFLEGNTAKSARKSLDNMANAIDCLQSDEKFKTLGRKNNLHTPKHNGYRSYKAAWNVPLGGVFVGKEMMAEIKIEHESQQDLNRMTRRFMNYSRKTRDAMERFYSNCTSESGGSRDLRIANKNMLLMMRNVEDLDKFSRLVYDYVHKNAGLNRFLDKSKEAQYAPAAPEVLQAAARKAIDAFGAPIAREIENAGVKLPSVRARAEKMEKTFS